MSEFHEIGDDELLYRKISVKSEWYDPTRQEIKPDAFKPWPRDTGGISFDRARSEQDPDFRTIEEAARGPSVKGYYVAVCRAGDLRTGGLTIVADPLDNNPGHTLLRDLTYSNCKEPSSREKMALLAHRLVEREEGPFSSGSE